MGKPTMTSKPTLIVECTAAKCSKWGKCYMTIGEYMWVMLEDGLLTREQAKHEYGQALRVCNAREA